MSTTSAEALILGLEQRNPNAARLAMLASAAVQVEPELLRALRLLLPEADAGTEADVWLSDLVESRSALAITLRADVRRALQERLAVDRAALDEVAAVLRRVHANVSEVIRIEERVTIESLRNEPGAQDRIDQLVAPVVAAIEQQRHRGLARWAVRAFDAAPPVAKGASSMWRLMRSSSVLRTQPADPSSTPVPLQSAVANLPRRRVRLALRKDALEVEAARTPRIAVINTRARAQIEELLRARGADVVEDIDLADGVILNPSHGFVLPTERKLPILSIAVTANPANLGPSIFGFLMDVEKLLLPASVGTKIDIPDTVPLLLEVAWHDDGRRSRRITLHPGDTAHVPLRPRNVTVSACNGEMFAIEPELELDDYAILVGGGEPFRDWLLSSGRLPAENVHEVRTERQMSETLFSLPRKVRRMYAYIEVLTDPTFLRDDGAFWLLRRVCEELVLIVDSMTDPQFTLPPRGGHELLLFRKPQSGPILAPFFEALDGAVATETGLITASDVFDYVRQHSVGVGGTSSPDFILRKNVFTTARLTFPRSMYGATMVLTSRGAKTIEMQIADRVEVIVRPGDYELTVPEYDYLRKLTFRPGYNDLSLAWRPNGRWVIVAGTASPRLEDGERFTCEAVARILADHGFGLMVGSYAGIDALAAEVYAQRVRFLGGAGVEVPRQYLGPSMEPAFNSGRILKVEDDYETPLVEASALVTIGGREGVEEYVRRARRRQVPRYIAEPSFNRGQARTIAQHLLEDLERGAPGFTTPA